MNDPAARRRLYREPEEKKLTGVCGGIADYLGVDPTIVRLAVVVLCFANGAAIVAYLVAAIVTPVRPDTVPRAQPDRAAVPQSWAPYLWFGLLASVVLLVGVGDGWWFDAPVLGLALVGVGAWLILRDREDQPAPAVARSSGENDIYRENRDAVSGDSTTLLVEVAPERAHAGPPASEDTSGSTHKTEDEPHPVPVPPEPSSSVPDHSAHRAGPQGEVPPPVPPWGLGTPPGVGPQPVHGGGGTTVGWLGVLLIVAGICAVLAVFDLVDLGVESALAVALVTLGVGLVVGSWRGRVRPLVGLGLPLVGLLVIGDAADIPFDGGTDDRNVVVDQRAELDDDYELLAGKLQLDLRQLSLGDGVPTAPLEDVLRKAGMDDPSLTRALRGAGDPPTLRAEVFVGELVVVVPEGMSVDVDALVWAGDIRGPRDREEGGVHAERHFVLDGDGDVVPGGGGAGDMVHLDLKMGLGEIEIRHA